jgi:hypothetical protein
VTAVTQLGIRPDTMKVSVPKAFPPLLSKAGIELHQYGRLGQARELYEAAYVAADRDNDRVALAEAALGIRGLWPHDHRTLAATQADARLQRAIAVTAPKSSLGLRLRIRLAGETDYLRGGHQSILAALEEARRADDPLAVAEAASLAHHCLLGPDESAIRAELVQTQIAAALRTGRRSDLLIGMLREAVNRLIDGDPRAERYLYDLRAKVSDQDFPAVRYVLQNTDVMRGIRAGKFAESEALSRECERFGQALGDPDASGWMGAQLVTIRWYQGRIGELVDPLRDLVDSPTLSGKDTSFFGALAVAAAASDDLRTAASTLNRVAGPGLDQIPRSSSWLVTLYGIVEAAHLLGEPLVARAAYDLLLPHSHRPLVGSLGVACFGSVEHALGVASLTFAEPQQAIDHLRKAVRRNLAFRHWPAAVLSRWRLGHALRVLGRREESAETAEHLATAEREAGELGMRLPRDANRREPVPAKRQTGLVTCRRNGRLWELALGSHVVHLEQMRGLQYLAILLANPRQEISAVELAAGPVTVPRTPKVVIPQPILDGVAKRQYRDRLVKLNADMNVREREGRFEEAERLDAERQWLVTELAVASGFLQRDRTFAHDEERARVAVGKAIRRAISRIEAIDALIGSELRHTIQTGGRCSYQPR